MPQHIPTALGEKLGSIYLDIVQKCKDCICFRKVVLSAGLIQVKNE